MIIHKLYIVYPLAITYGCSFLSREPLGKRKYLTLRLFFVQRFIMDVTIYRHKAVSSQHQAGMGVGECA